ncbi:monosaccharide ABC transporter membrane protein, CUT2 family [Caballeronia arationis]|jgi:ribose transport system permease protein|uniref:Monosaccharide ABC transporter membrane protein, CUT2 family n=1 Tax=Caballeronia arationis TaxID=1777142 RepID=A0A7Z7N6R4_9BURK|nr:ABC transporter permease [Caballeronia arationis]SOE88334.1 monosaccharide ABC transporter membrane protein, CUT2 family [Caballeronia arationis]
MKKNLPILIALVALLVLGVTRYEHFASAYNITSFWRYNSMFALISVGMAFVIMTGGIDLSVGAVAALGSVVAALASSHGGLAAVLAGSCAGLAVGVLNGLVITHMRILPFIVTLATSLGAHGLALLLGHNDAVAISAESNFANFGQGDLFGLPIPGLVAAAAAVLGWIALRSTRFGRHALAIGGSEEASRLMGLNVDRTLVSVYAVSGLLAGIAGAILAAQFGAGQPNEGVGWELFAISAVVLGGTRLTGGEGSIAMTIAGVALLGLVFNLLNFENGLGFISLSAYWQSVIRGLFLLLVIVLQARVLRRRTGPVKVAH